ncbi:hypothetical protein VTP01DRAFT_6703 [Rhizomucor pusillus]|uniref:uncharacterized protein n=1 Tax=Rhizomucor pusillus TaxID=4840 RepID=UPI003743F5BA
MERRIRRAIERRRGIPELPTLSGDHPRLLRPEEYRQRFGHATTHSESSSIVEPVCFTPTTDNSSERSILEGIRHRLRISHEKKQYAEHDLDNNLDNNQNPDIPKAHTALPASSSRNEDDTHQANTEMDVSFRDIPQKAADESVQELENALNLKRASIEHDVNDTRQSVAAYEAYKDDYYDHGDVGYAAEDEVTDGHSVGGRNMTQLPMNTADDAANAPVSREDNTPSPRNEDDMYHTNMELDISFGDVSPKAANENVQETETVPNLEKPSTERNNNDTSRAVATYEAYQDDYYDYGDVDYAAEDEVTGDRNVGDGKITQLPMNTADDAANMLVSREDRVHVEITDITESYTYNFIPMEEIENNGVSAAIESSAVYPPRHASYDDRMLQDLYDEADLSEEAKRKLEATLRDIRTAMEKETRPNRQDNAVTTALESLKNTVALCIENFTKNNALPCIDDYGNALVEEFDRIGALEARRSQLMRQLKRAKNHRNRTRRRLMESQDEFSARYERLLTVRRNHFRLEERQRVLSDVARSTIQYKNKT